LLGGLRLGADASFILASHKLVGLPMFLPALFVELRSHSTNSHVHSCKLKLQSVEQTTEIRRDDVLSNLGKTRTDVANLDLDGTGLDIEMRRVKGALRGLDPTLLRVKGHEASLTRKVP
jgi:hypothetical protein